MARSEFGKVGWKKRITKEHKEWATKGKMTGSLKGSDLPIFEFNTNGCPDIPTIRKMLKEKMKESMNRKWKKESKVG